MEVAACLTCGLDKGHEGVLAGVAEKVLPGVLMCSTWWMKAWEYADGGGVACC